MLDTLVHARGLCFDVLRDVFSFIDAMSTETWIETFKKETVDIAKMDVNALTYVESASRMRQLLKTGRFFIVFIVCDMLYIYRFRLSLSLVHSNMFLTWRTVRANDRHSTEQCIPRQLLLFYQSTLILYSIIKN